MRDKSDLLYCGVNYRFFDDIDNRTNHVVGYNIMNCTTEEEALRYVFMKVLVRLEFV